jgi:hypothetical protein
MDRRQMIEELELWYKDNAVDLSGDGEPVIAIGDDTWVELSECIENLQTLGDSDLWELYQLHVKFKLDVPDTMQSVLDTLGTAFKN